MTERELQSAIEKIAKMYGWLYYHTYNSRRSQKGFPDLVLVRGREVIFAELKSATGQLSLEQYQWRAALELSSARYYLWRPGDLDDIVKILDRKDNG